MSTTPHELLALAEQLPTNDEASNRTAAGRAYYAAYHACQQVYKTAAQPQSTGMHKAFISTLQTSTASLDRKIGYILKSIHDTRIQADYKLNDEFPSICRNRAIADATRILSLLQA